MSYEKNYVTSEGNEYLVEIDINVNDGEVYLEVFEAFPIVDGVVSEYSIGGECKDYNEIEQYCESFVSNEAPNIEQDHRESMADAYYESYKDGLYYGN